MNGRAHRAHERAGTVDGRRTRAKGVIAAALVACIMGTAVPAEARYRDGMNLYQYVQTNPVDRTDPKGLSWKTKIFHADAVGFDMAFADVGFSGPFPYNLLSIAASLGVQYLYNCRSAEEAVYLYGGIGIGFGYSMTPISYATGVGPIFVYNLPTAVDYTGSFVSAKLTAAFGVGVSAEVFTTPGDLMGLMTGTAKDPLWGWGVGYVAGTPQVGVTGQYQYFIMLGSTVNPALRVKLCEECPAGASRSMPRDKAALVGLVKQMGQFPWKDLRDAGQAKAQAISLGKLVPLEIAKASAGKGFWARVAGDAIWDQYRGGGIPLRYTNPVASVQTVLQSVERN